MLLKSEKKSTLLYSLIAILFAGTIGSFYHVIQVEKDANLLIAHTKEVLQKNDNLLLSIVNMETGARGFVLTGKENYLEPYINGSNKINVYISELSELIKDNKNQLRNVDTLKILIAEKNNLITILINEKRQKNITTLRSEDLLNKGKILTDEIRNRISSINREELKLLESRKIDSSKNNQIVGYLFISILIFILGIVLFVINITKKSKAYNAELQAFSITQKILYKYSRSLIEASLDPLITINPAGKITDTNEATVSITGKTRNTLIGSDFFEYFTEPQKAREVYQQVFLKGFVADSPLTLLHADGTITDVLFNGSVYKDDQGEVKGVVIVARDVTEQKIIEKEMLEAKLFAELATDIAEHAKYKAEAATLIASEAVKTKQQFLSNMSHEIRTPMNAIIGFTKVLLKTELNEKQLEYLEAIKLSGDALIVLINDILDLAKVDSGKMVFEKIPFKLSLSISAMLHLFEPKIQEKNLTLIKEYDGRIPEVLLGDPVRLHQIILNLVSNAVKFTSKGCITAGVTLITETTEDVTIEFSISDTGIGIPESKIDNIFENFQQASSGTSRLYGGTGLGLAIFKQLVEQQGGRISMKSKIGVGSTFSFQLSFKKTNELVESNSDLLKLNENLPQIKVLVVEDIALNQLLMKTLLDEFGFEREIAANGRIAIEKIQKENFDIILMDLQMPEMNGFEATDYIRNTLKLQMPIIALTADVTTVDLEKCKLVGMNDYIAKPVDERILYTKIINLVKKDKSNKINASNILEMTSTNKMDCTDLTSLIRRTKKNPILMKEMILAYLEQTPILVNLMKTYYAERDNKSLRTVMHKLIPSFSIVGINEEYENMAKKIMEYTRSDEEIDGISLLVLKVENICNQACIELHEVVSKMDTGIV